MQNRSSASRTNVVHHHDYRGPNLALINGRHVAAKFRDAQLGSGLSSGVGLAFPSPELTASALPLYSRPSAEPADIKNTKLGCLEETTLPQLKIWDLARTRKVGQSTTRRRSRSSVKINEALVRKLARPSRSSLSQYRTIDMPGRRPKKPRRVREFNANLCRATCVPPSVNDAPQQTMEDGEIQEDATLPSTQPRPQSQNQTQPQPQPQPAQQAILDLEQVIRDQRAQMDRMNRDRVDYKDLADSLSAGHAEEAQRIRHRIELRLYREQKSGDKRPLPDPDRAAPPRKRQRTSPIDTDQRYDWSEMSLQDAYAAVKANPRLLLTMPTGLAVMIKDMRDRNYAEFAGNRSSPPPPPPDASLAVAQSSIRNMRGRTQPDAARGQSQNLLQDLHDRHPEVTRLDPNVQQPGLFGVIPFGFVEGQLTAACRFFKRKMLH